MNKLNGKVAIVTGGSGGIGSAIVKKLIDQGASVLFTYYTGKSKAVQIVKDINDNKRVKAIPVNLRELSEINNMFELALSDFGEIDILVNNAAQSNVCDIESITEEEHDLIFDINTKAPLFCIQHAAKKIRNGGRIINISSINTKLPESSAALYSASKAALEQISKIAARELASREITVNCISPGPVNTDFLINNNSNEVLEQIKIMTPLGRIAEPEDVANIVAFLASNDSRWITGQNLKVCGGLI